jgi:hypothetical protein
VRGRRRPSCTPEIILLVDDVRRSPAYGRAVVPRSAVAILRDELPFIYGAAVAACAGPAAAEAVCARVLAEAVRESSLGRFALDRRALVERALLLAVRVSPAAGLAGMSPCDREVCVLARLAGYPVDDIALTLEIDPDEAKARISSGLRALAGATRAATAGGPA